MVTEFGLSVALGLTEDRLDDLSAPYAAATDELVRGIRDELGRFDREALTSEQQLSARIYAAYLEDLERVSRCRDLEYLVHPAVVAPHNQLLLFLEEIHPVEDLATGRAYVERLRQVRVKLDTGLHSQGWSFDQAVAYLVANVGYAPGAAQAEITRYMAWPGQATAYLVGQRSFLELREEARAAQGPAFDLRDFHDAVLGAGSLPLDLLEEQVRLGDRGRPER